MADDNKHHHHVTVEHALDGLLEQPEVVYENTMTHAHSGGLKPHTHPESFLHSSGEGIQGIVSGVVDDIKNDKFETEGDVKLPVPSRHLWHGQD